VDAELACVDVHQQGQEVSFPGRIREILRFEDGACCVEDWREETEGFKLYVQVNKA
jgi:hypothetical protein